MHGGHQVAQKLIKSTFPFCLEISIVLPLPSLNTTEGAVGNSVAVLASALLTDWAETADCLFDSFMLFFALPNNSAFASGLISKIPAMRRIIAEMIPALEKILDFKLYNLSGSTEP